jgi:hypothetical protein
MHLVKGGNRIDMTKAIAVHVNVEYRRRPDNASKEREL